MKTVQNSLSYLNDNNKVKYGIIVILILFVFIRYKIYKKKQNILKKILNETQNVENKQEQNEGEEETDVESSIEIIKKKNEEKYRRKNLYNYLMNNQNSLLHYLNPISVYMMIRQNSSKSNTSQTVNHTNNEAQSPSSNSSPKKKKGITSSLSLKHIRNKSNDSALQDLLKSQSNECISHSHRSSSHHHHQNSYLEHGDSHSSISSTASSISNRSNESNSNHLHHRHSHRSHHSVTHDDDNEDKKSCVSESQHSVHSVNSKTSHRPLIQKSNSVIVTSQNKDKNRRHQLQKHGSSPSSLRVSVSLNSNITGLTSGPSPVTKSSPLRESYFTSQTDINESEANKTASSSNPAGAEASTSKPISIHHQNSNSSFSTSPIRNSNFLGSFSSLRGSIFGKNRNREANSNINRMSSTNSMNGHAPSESSISITSGNHSPSSSTPRSTFFDIIRQGFELFRDDYSNQYIEELLDIYRDENVTRALKSKKGGATDDELKFLKTVIYIPKENEDDTRPPVKEISNEFSEGHSNTSNVNGSSVGEDEDINAMDLLPSPSSDKPPITKNKGKGKEVDDEDELKCEVIELPLDHYISNTISTESSSLPVEPLSPSTMDDKASSSNSLELLPPKEEESKSISSSIHPNPQQDNSINVPANDTISQKPEATASSEETKLKKESKNNSNQIIYDEKTCSICFEDFHVNEKVIMLEACSHIFHRHCISSWLKIKKDCPICRRDVIFNNDKKSNEKKSHEKKKKRSSHSRSSSIHTHRDKNNNNHHNASSTNPTS